MRRDADMSILDGLALKCPHSNCYALDVSVYPVEQIDKMLERTDETGGYRRSPLALEQV